MDGYYRRSTGVASRVVDGEAVLVKMPEGMLHVLNPSASRMWVRADGARPASELARGVDEAAAAEFLSRMTELGLMEVAPAPGAEAAPFSQDADIAPSTEAPEIRASEPVETLASGTCIVDALCIPPSG